MDTGPSEPSWSRTAWNTIRITTQRRLFASPARRAVTALVACAAVAAGLFVYAGVQRAPAAPAISSTAPTLSSSSGASAGSDGVPAASTASRPITDPAALVAAAKALAAHSRLMLKPAAQAQLISGTVDPRVTAALRLLLARHVIQVTSFGTREEGMPLRAIKIDCIDELPINARSNETADVLEFFGNLRPALAPRSVRVIMEGKATVIVATYPAAAG